VYSTDLFDQATIKRLGSHFQTLLQAILKDPDKTIANLDILNEEEKKTLIQWERPGDAAAGVERSLLDQVILQAQLRPDQTALSSSGRSLGYGELAQRSAALAHQFLRQGVCAGMRVGLLADTDADSIVALLALWRAGAIVAPLDADLPAPMLEGFVREARLSTVLAKDAFLPKIKGSGFTLLSLESQLALAKDSSPDAPPMLPEIVLGTPAWLSFGFDGPCTFTHRMVAKAVERMANAFPLDAGETMLAEIRLGDCGAIAALFWPLVSGASLYLLSVEEARNIPQTLAGHNQPAAVLQLSSEQWVAFLHSGAAKEAAWAARWLIASGSLITPALALEISRLTAGEFCYLHATGESAGFVARSQFHLVCSAANLAVSIGVPLAPGCRVEDDLGQLSPIGVWGWLAVTEPGDASPINTGERVRWTAAGQLEIDLVNSRSVLANGLRLNLRAIESICIESGLLHGAAAISRFTAAGLARIVLYVAAKGELAQELLRSYLLQKLPARFDPVFVSVSAIPLTLSGQIDREALLRIPVIDESFAREAEAQLRQFEEVEDAAVFILPRRDPIPAIHISDILPELSGDAESERGAAPINATTPGLQSSGKLSECRGVPLILAANAPRTLPDALIRAAASGNSIIFAEDGVAESTLRYAELQSEAEKVLAGLRQRGLMPGDKVIFQCGRNFDFIVSFWACQLGGFVPVPLQCAPVHDSSSLVLAKFAQVCQMLEYPLVLCSGRVYDGLMAMLGDLKFDERVRLVCFDHLRNHPRDAQHAAVEPSDLALLLLTSGSTGRPKCVVHSHSSLLAYCAGNMQHNRFNPNDITFNWMPLDHVGGIVMFHLRDVYITCTQIHSPTDFILQDPTRWLDAIDRHRVTITWAPNFAYALVNSCAATMSGRRWDLSCLRYAMNGGEAVVPRVARLFLQLLAPFGLQPAAMMPTWGMSETSSSTVCSHRFRADLTRDEDQFASVGSPIPGFALRIVNNEGHVVTEGIEGRLQVAGPSVTTGYLSEGSVDRDKFTEDGWFETGDLGTVNDGQLFITGRIKDVILINGVNHYCHDIESIVEEIEGVEPSFTAACAVRNSGSTTDSMAIFFHPREKRLFKDAHLLNEIRGRVTRSAGIAPEYIVPVAKEDVPKTTIGKIQRSALCRDFESGKFAAALREVDLLIGSAKTVPNWFYVPAWKPKAIQGVRSPWILSQKANRVLIFAQDQRLGSGALQGLFASYGRGTICPACSRDSEQSQSAGEQYLRPEAPEDYDAFLGPAFQEARGPVDVIHAWTLGNQEVGSPAKQEEMLQRGLYSLLHLLQAMHRNNPAGYRCRLLVLSSQTQFVCNGDAVSPAKAALLGLLRTAQHEFDWLKVKHIDFDQDTLAGPPELLVWEAEENDAEAEIAYRCGVRHVRRLERLTFDRASTGAQVCIEHGGIYLLTGGLGGISEVIATYLLEKRQCRLILTGRTPHSELSAEKQSRLARLRKLGQVEYVEYVASGQTRATLDEAVRQFEERHSRRLSGIFQMAGVFEETPLTELTIAGLARVLEPKVEVSQIAREIARTRPGCALIYFSSANGYFGGATVAAYAAANAYLDASALSDRGSGNPCQSLAWSMWEETGMSKGYHLSDLSQSRGYQSIGRNQGVQAMLAALAYGPGHTLIGLDGANPHMRPLIYAPAAHANKLIAYIKPKDAAPEASLIGSSLDMQDAFGCKVTLLVAIAGSSSLLADGALDRAALMRIEAGSDSPARECVEARNDLERSLIAIWKEVLGRDKVGVHDNFFDLGGHSIRLAQVFAKMSDLIPAGVTMIDLFKYPTIASLAAYISGTQPTSRDDTHTRADARRGALARQQNQVEARRRASAKP
jgi:acyl-CoA synthetase (AMP-forming)/AMP-acid ligase II/NAD(P)-dependent dehydrogenase (short-subunit alcohol dehydrogenase family)